MLNNHFFLKNTKRKNRYVCIFVFRFVCVGMMTTSFPRWEMCTKMQSGQPCSPYCTFAHNPLHLQCVSVHSTWKTIPCHRTQRCDTTCTLLHEDEWFVRNEKGTMGLLMNKLGIVVKFQIIPDPPPRVKMEPAVVEEIKDKKRPWIGNEPGSKKIKIEPEETKKPEESKIKTRPKEMKKEPSEKHQKGTYVSPFKPNREARDKMRKLWFTAES
jgi:hypothetical protein